MLAAICALLLVAAQPAERIVDLRVQGNTLTPDADVVRMSGVEIGSEMAPGLLERVAARLKTAGRFERVEVLKRYASIADPSRILLVIVVDEGRVVVKPARNGQPARAVRRRLPPLMLLPIVGAPDGYGFTYGALVTMPNVLGPRTRVSVPLTLGGERRAGVEFEKRRDSARLTRLRVGGSILSRRNPAFSRTDDRVQVWAKGERELVKAVRVGAWSGFDTVEYAGEKTRMIRAGADAIVDTRVDPMLSRNAVYLRGAVERLADGTQAAARHTVLDASAYLPGIGPSTLVVRLMHDGANAPLPPWQKVLIGRDDTLRGYPAGYAAGDSTAAGQIELRVPFTPPLDIVKAGVRGFVDMAAAYDAGERLRDQRFERSAGGGVWVTATVIRLALDVAHGSNGSTRVVISSAVLF